MVTCAGRQPACSMGKQSVDFSVLASGRGLTKCGNDAVLFSKRHRHFFGGGAKSSSPFFFWSIFLFFVFRMSAAKSAPNFFWSSPFFFWSTPFWIWFCAFHKKALRLFVFWCPFFSGQADNLSHSLCRFNTTWTQGQEPK